MFCCERARATRRVHGDEVHLPALWCYTAFKAAAVFVFPTKCLSVSDHPFSPLTPAVSPRLTFASVFYMLQHFQCQYDHNWKRRTYKRLIQPLQEPLLN